MHAMPCMPCMLCAPPPPQAAPCNVCPSPYIRSCARTGLAQDLDTRARPRGPSRIRRPENSEERVLRSNPYEKRRFPPPRQACQRHEYVWYALLPARYACLLVAMLRSIATSKQAYRTAEPALCMPCHAMHACMLCAPPPPQAAP